MDDIDRLTEQQEKEAEWDARDKARLAAQTPVQQNRFCWECGNELPLVRQALNAPRCIDCQLDYEWQRRVWKSQGGPW